MRNKKKKRKRRIARKRNSFRFPRIEKLGGNTPRGECCSEPKRTTALSLPYALASIWFRLPLAEMTGFSGLGPPGGPISELPVDLLSRLPPWFERPFQELPLRPTKSFLHSFAPLLCALIPGRSPRSLSYLASIYRITRPQMR
jgi:hypothetical protein